MKKLHIVMAAMLLMFAACQNYHPSVIRTNKAKEYRSKTTRISHRKKNRKTPPATPKNAVVANLNADKPFFAVTATTVAPWINAYTTANGLPYPQYFIMTAQPLLQFLQTNPSAYLHVYLSLNNQTGSTDLVIVGANQNAAASDYSFTDFPTTVGPGASQVFSNFMTAPAGYGVVADEILEPPADRYQNYPGGPLKVIPPQMPLTQAAANINNYQQPYNQFALAYSFLINTQDLADFLSIPAHQWDFATQSTSSGPNIVKYIQIYLAYENSDSDNSTIILAGLDASGNHVYYFNGSAQSVQVFNTAVPCPFCNVDASIFTPPSMPVSQ